MFSFYFCDFFDQKLKNFLKNCCQIHIFKAFLSKLQQLLEFKKCNSSNFQKHKSFRFSKFGSCYLLSKNSFFSRFLWLLWRKANCWKISKKKSTASTLKRVLSFPRATKFFLIGKKNFFFCKKSNGFLYVRVYGILSIFVIFLTKN